MNKESKEKKEIKFNIDKDKIINKFQNISLKVIDFARVVIIILSIMLLALIAVKAFYKTGYFPAAVSPDSIIALVPSYTALATSEISALVGRGL